MAIHIQRTLSTDLFILNLRHFTGQRGIVRMIMSDNGAHFVNASAEMDMCLSRNGSQENW